MSIDHIARVLRLPADVTGTNRMVLLVLAEAANQDTDECWPSTVTIRQRAGLKQDRYVQKAVASLVDMGLIVVDPNGCPDRRVRPDRRPNLYRLTGVLAVANGGARRADGGARRAGPGVRDAQTSLHIEPEVEPERDRGDPGGSLLADLAAPHMHQPPVRPFDEFWRVYPLRKSKGAARTAWAKAIRTTHPDVIIAAALRYRGEPGRELRYTKHPATWLNGECWTDESPPRTVTETHREVVEH